MPKVVAQQRRGRASNPRLIDRKSDALPLSHRATPIGIGIPLSNKVTRNLAIIHRVRHKNNNNLLEKFRHFDSEFCYNLGILASKLPVLHNFDRYLACIKCSRLTHIFNSTNTKLPEMFVGLHRILLNAWIKVHQSLIEVLLYTTRLARIL